jgi:type IV pilus assembly protein PilQ
LAAPSAAAAWGPLPQASNGAAAGGRTIQDIRLREAGGATVLEVLADQPLVWTSYRDAEGNLVIELPNSQPDPALGDVRQSDGLVSLVIVNMDEGASRPLTRLTVKTREEADHTLSAEGNGLRLELLPLAAGSTLLAESSAPAAAEPAQAEPLAPPVETAAEIAEQEDLEASQYQEDAYQDPVVETAKAVQVKPAEPSPVVTAGLPPAPAPTAMPPDGKDFEIVSSGAALSDPATILEGVELLQGGEGTALQIRGDGEFTYSSFRLENPDRFVIDLAGVVNASSTTTIPVSSPVLDRVRIAQFKPFPQPVARVVFDLPYAQVPVIDSESSGLRVRFGTAGAGASAVAAEAPVTIGVPAPEPLPAVVAEVAQAQPEETEPEAEVTESVQGEPLPAAEEPAEAVSAEAVSAEAVSAEAVSAEAVSAEAVSAEAVSAEAGSTPAAEASWEPATDDSVSVAEAAPASPPEEESYGEPEEEPYQQEPYREAEVIAEANQETTAVPEPSYAPEPAYEEAQPVAEEAAPAEAPAAPEPSYPPEPTVAEQPTPAVPLPEPVAIVAVEERPAPAPPVVEAPEEQLEEVPEPVAPAPVPIIEKPAPAAETAPIGPAAVAVEAPEAKFKTTTKIPTTDVTLFEEADLQRAPIAERREPLTERIAPEVVGAGGRVYSGDPVSMSLKNADIKDVLKSFAGITGLNVVVHPGVKGSVTVELEGVPWDQALDLILKINGLDYVLEGNIMRIATTDQLSKEADARRKLAAARAKEVPLETVIRALSYNSATAVAQLLRSSGGGSRGGGGSRSSGRGILSPRGSVTVDRLNNKLIIKEVPSNMNTVLAVIDSIDVSIPQVLIEARIVETTKNFSRSLGIQWDFGAVADDEFGNTTGLQFPHRASADGGVNLLTGGRNAFLDISLGNILDTFTLDASLQAAENEGLATILSAPRVTTLNNTTATISSGLQIPIQTTANNTVNVRFVNAGLSMEVTPYVTAEGTVLMDINIAKREPLLAFAIAGAANAPISVKQARTSVIVRDGGTTVIGGIYEVSTNQGEDRVPGLANVPLLGHLFKNRRRSNDNEELLIFITPRVMQL